MAKAATPETDSKPVASRFSADTGTVRVSDADAAITPLLHRATTLKMRGQWEEAITVATDAVRRAPASATAHALLGDIYAAQNNNDDALHWYRMALARNPQDTVVAQKHEVLLTQKRAAITSNIPVVTLSHGRQNNPADSTSELSTGKAPVLTAKMPLPSGTAERTLEWLDRIFPPGRSEGMARLLFTISGIVALLVVVTGTFLYFGNNKSDSDADSPIAIGEISTVTSPPILPRVSSSPTAVQPDAGTIPVPQESAAATPASPTASSELMKQLAVLQSSEVTITAADTDASKTQVQLELAVAAHPDSTTATTRNRILSAATTACRAALAALPSLERFSVRVLIKTNVGTTAPINSTLVFVGGTSRTALQVVGSNEKNPSPSLLASLFTNTWWENRLNPALNP